MGHLQAQTPPFRAQRNRQYAVRPVTVPGGQNRCADLAGEVSPRHLMMASVLNRTGFSPSADENLGNTDQRCAGRQRPGGPGTHAVLTGHYGAVMISVSCRVRIVKSPLGPVHQRRADPSRWCVSCCRPRSARLPPISSATPWETPPSRRLAGDRADAASPLPTATLTTPDTDPTTVVGHAGPGWAVRLPARAITPSNGGMKVTLPGRASGGLWQRL